MRITAKVFYIVLLLSAGCAYRQALAPKNMTDYFFVQSSHSPSHPSAAFSARRALDGVLYSQCRWLPSDSEFLEQTSQSCGSLKATVLALGRSFEEPDIALDSQHPVVNLQGHLRWIHLPLECEL